MQHDPTDSQPKITPLPQEKRFAPPTLAESSLNPPVAVGTDEHEDNESEHNLQALQPCMPSRFFHDDDQKDFLSWVATDVPLELEIGSGKGLFLTNSAKRSPNHRFVGLELAAKYALECQSRIEKIGIPNARFFACDAVAVLDQDVGDGSLDAVHVYFPDPWWKSRHKKRRVLNEKSLVNIERTLKASGSFHFWTDVLDYYEGTLELIDRVTKLKGPFFVSEPQAEHDMDYLTHFERRTRRNGLPVYRSRFTKG